MKFVSKLIIVILLFCGVTNDGDSQTCYITETGTKYHTSSCSYLSYSAYTIDLDSAISKGYGPCSRCRPAKSSLKYSTNSSTKSNYSFTSSKCTTVVCSGLTKSGRSCRRKTKDCSGRCHSHRQ